MDLRNNPVVMIFVETTSVDRARRLFEDVIGLPVIENQFHPPHHHHGIFKYDAGNVILALNLARSADSRAASEEGIRTVVRMRHAGQRLRGAIEAGLGTDLGGGVMIDQDGHRFEFVEAYPDQPAPRVVRIVYAGHELQRMRRFHLDQLGLAPARHDVASYHAGRILLSVEQSDLPRHVAMRHDGYLTVVYTPDIRQTAAMLPAQAIPLLGEVRFASIGGTVRFADPAGHQFCLYQPAANCFDWGSGAKLAELVGPRQMGEVPW
jgi:hypothetical protein